MWVDVAKGAMQSYFWVMAISLPVPSENRAPVVKVIFGDEDDLRVDVYCRCLIIEVFKGSIIQGFNYSRVQLYKYTIIQVFRYTIIQVYKYKYMYSSIYFFIHSLAPSRSASSDTSINQSPSHPGGWGPDVSGAEVTTQMKSRSWDGTNRK